MQSTVCRDAVDESSTTAATTRKLTGSPPASPSSVDVLRSASRSPAAAVSAADAIPPAAEMQLPVKASLPTRSAPGGSTASTDFSISSILGRRTPPPPVSSSRSPLPPPPAGDDVTPPQSRDQYVDVLTTSGSRKNDDDDVRGHDVESVDRGVEADSDATSSQHRDSRADVMLTTSGGRKTDDDDDDDMRGFRRRVGADSDPGGLSTALRQLLERQLVGPTAAAAVAAAAASGSPWYPTWLQSALLHRRIGSQTSSTDGLCFTLQ